MILVLLENKNVRLIERKQREKVIQKQSLMSKFLPVSGGHTLGKQEPSETLVLCALSFVAVRLGNGQPPGSPGQGNLEHSPGDFRASVKTDHCTSDKM